MKLTSIPFVLILTFIWSSLRLYGADLSLTAVAGIIVLITAMLAMKLEFYKSGDIGLRSFGVDTAYAGLQLIVGSIMATVLVVRSAGFYTVDAIVCFAILSDSWLSPYNSFRTALRNINAQVGGSSHSDSQ